MKKRNIFACIAVLMLSAILYITKDEKGIVFLLLAAATYGISFKYFLRRVTGKIDILLKMEEGKDRVRVCVKNGSWFPSLTVKGEMVAENILTGQKDKTIFSFAPGPKRSVENAYHIKDQLCGAIEVSIEKVYVEDLFGFIKKEIDIKQKMITYVLPQIRELDTEISNINAYDMESFKYATDRKGDDPSETFGINTYKPGDSIKSIHWKMSCKIDDIAIREPGLPIENNLLILIDKSDNGDSNFKKEKKSQFTELAVSMSRELATKEIHHSIGWFNQRKDEFQIFSVKDERDIWEYMPELLSSPYYEKGDSAAVKFLEADCEKQFSNILLISNSDRGADRLSNYGKVDIYGTETTE